MADLTRILRRAGDGDPEANERLAVLLYDELRSLARRELAGERVGHTLQPTALVHEAYLRLLGDDATFESRAHFYGAAARAIRRVLVDHARRRARLKRGGDRERVALEEHEPAAPQRDAHLLALDDVLERLAGLDERKARLVELRFFAGASLEEAARVLDVSVATVGREWRMARAWLRTELADAGVVAEAGGADGDGDKD